MKLNPSIKNMSNEYIFFTDQTALTFRICLVVTPWSIVILEELKDPQLVKKFSAFYGARWFIVIFTRARHGPVS